MVSPVQVLPFRSFSHTALGTASTGPEGAKVGLRLKSSGTWRVGRWRVALNIDVEMPTVESIRRLAQRNEGVAFLPRMCEEQEVGQGRLYEVEVEELSADRNIRLVCATR